LNTPRLLVTGPRLSQLLNVVYVVLLADLLAQHNKFLGLFVKETSKNAVRFLLTDLIRIAGIIIATAQALAVDPLQAGISARGPTFRTIHPLIIAGSLPFAEGSATNDGVGTLT